MSKNNAGLRCRPLLPPDELATWKLVPPDWNLCHICQQLLFKPASEVDLSSKFGWWVGKEPSGWRSFIPRAAIAEGRANGCTFCKTILCSASWAWGREEDPTIHLDVTLSQLDASTIGVDIGFHVRPITIAIEPVWEPAVVEEFEGLRFMQDQLRSCLGGHPKCQPTTPPDGISWPSRIVTVAKDMVTVVDFDPKTIPGNFAALSYCWGSPLELEQNPPLKLTALTSKSLRSGVRLSKLPLTLQHAVQVCAALGIRYIWIDSLCILQRSRKVDPDALRDWEVEATKMETVYARARVTIIAASSTSCHSGFLKDRVSSMHPPVPLKPDFQLTTRITSRSGHHAGSRAMHPDVGLEPIDSRGWTYQEQLLSSRYIKFTSDDVQWKCDEHVACLCKANANVDYLRQWPDRAAHPLLRWPDIVKYFSPRLVTVGTDKLLAVSSLARALATEAGLRDGITPGYFAGVWGETLFKVPPQLGWYRNGEIGPCSEHYIAPSFSWASIELKHSPGIPGIGIQDPDFTSAKGDSVCEVLDIAVTPKSADDPFSRVSAGYVTLRAPLLSCTLAPPENGTDIGRQTVMTLDPSFPVRGPQGTVAQPHAFLDCFLSELTLSDGTKSLQRARTHAHTDEIIAWALLLSNSSTPPTIASSIAGLVLGLQDPMDTSGGKAYQRLGTFTLSLYYTQSEKAAGLKDVPSDVAQYLTERTGIVTII